MYLLFLLFLMVLLSIAFFTLLERKILGYIQLRKGPNKVLVLGVFQPMSDGMKLFLKENNFNFNLNKFMFLSFPIFMLFLMFCFWMCFVFMKFSYLFHSMIYLMMISSLGVYGIIGSGWSSNSKYAMLGSYRSVSQVVSYEVSLIFILMFLFLSNKNYNIYLMVNKNLLSHMFIFIMFYMLILWFVIILAELNRAPFDFSEAESELVSGFNIEFGSIKFAFLFLSEYGNMVFMSLLTILLFMIISNLLMLMFMVGMIWVRGSLPRFRYDNLMFLNWKFYLPLVLFSFSFKYFYDSILFL